MGYLRWDSRQFYSEITVNIWMLVSFEKTIVFNVPGKGKIVAKVNSIGIGIGIKISRREVGQA